VPLEIEILTLFPEMLAGPLAASIPARIQDEGLATIRVHDLREWGLGRHRSVDDAPYGGGAGMVLRPEPVAAALAALRRPDSTVILFDAAGEPFRQRRAEDLATRSHLVLVCPRYEGVDDRIRRMVDLELSIGDVVLTGGELPALVVCDAILRLLPGAIEPGSLVDESFTSGLLEYPQYTRPAVFEGIGIPEILTSGDHGAVRRWRLRESLRRTLDRRPDLLEGRTFSVEEARLLDEVVEEREAQGIDGAPRESRPPGREGIDTSREGGWRVLYSAVGRPPATDRSCPESRLAGPSRPPSAAGVDPVNVLDEIVKDQIRSDIPALAPGDTVKVSAKVVEGNRERVQIFEGTILRLTGGGITRSLTVRRIASGVGVERTFKVNSPRIEKIEVVRHGVARRAKLYFLRRRVGKSATLRERRTS
jgi:tRNA (guanine37-N1)-methyltransferase